MLHPKIHSIMEKLELQYQGNLRVQATHMRSGTKITTDAPVDNHGLGQSFSPTDLLCTAACACMLTIMGIAADTHGIDLKGVKVQVEKEMAAEPRRVGAIHMTVDLRGCNLDKKQRTILERSAQTCPVLLSLHPDVKKDIQYLYE